MQKPFSIQLELYFAHPRKTAINYIVADEKTMPLYIQLFKNGAPFALSDGAIIEINFENSAGLRFPRLGVIQDNEQGRILYEIEPADIAITGQMKASITVVNDMQRLTWQEFEFSVSRNLSDNQVDPPETLGPWKNAIEGRLSDYGRRIIALEEHETDIDVDLSGIKSALDEALAAIAELQATVTEARSIANNAANTAAAAGYRAEDGIRRADSAQAAVDALAVRVAALE